MTNDESQIDSLLFGVVALMGFNGLVTDKEGFLHIRRGLGLLPKGILGVLLIGRPRILF